MKVLIVANREKPAVVEALERIAPANRFCLVEKRKYRSSPVMIEEIDVLKGLLIYLKRNHRI